MKIEIEENTGVTIVLSVLIVSACGLILGGCQITEQTSREAIKAGLVQKPTSTSGAPVRWEKP